MKQIIKFIIRPIALPFFSAIALIGALIQWAMYSINFLRFGGEAIAFTKKQRGRTITEALNKLIDQQNQTINQP
jgi:hypothetical protein